MRSIDHIYTTMNIALCTDEKYSYPCGVCITSILENNKEEECNFYILTTGLKPETCRKFKYLENKYKQKIEIVKIENHTLNNLKASDRFPRSIYYRFLLPEILDCDKVLYLDCDIIVTAKLSKLWNTDLQGYACGVIEDQCGDDITLHNRIDNYNRYFNSGVLLMNLQYWREQHVAEKLVNFISTHPEKCLYPDQDALNSILSEQVLFLEYQYNYQELFLRNATSILLHKSKWCNLLPSNVIPTIIHYTGQTKPWHKMCRHPYASIFQEFKKMSPWKNVMIKSQYSLKNKFEMILRYVIYILRS